MIVPFPISVALKDEGYYKEQNKYAPIYIITKIVDDTPQFTLSNIIEDKNTLYRITEMTYFNILPHIYFAPTTDEVLKWLREEHNVHINILFSPTTKQHILKLFIYDKELKSYVLYHTGKAGSPLKAFNTYREAELYGIEITLNEIL